jgi:rhodanese-related sulfurtransferase
MVRPITFILGKLRVMVREGIFILLLAVTLAMLANTVRPRGLPLFAPPLWKQGVGASQPAVSIEEAERLFAYQRAVFIDARSPALYAASHIRGARNIPDGAGENLLKETLADLPNNSMLIVYCDDETSAVSRSLSKALSIMNKARDVRVLLRGWDQWVTNELPIEAGQSPVPRGKAG